MPAVFSISFRAHDPGVPMTALTTGAAAVDTRPIRSVRPST